MSKNIHITKMKIKIRLFILFFLASTSIHLFAQEKNLESKWIDSLQIDADFKDWKDTLQYYFKDQDIKYSVANDANYLYISIQIPNQAQQLKAIYSGFSITVNPDGKEKEGPTVVFPLPDVAALRAMNAKEDYEKTKDLRKAGLNMIRAIFVHGFKNIVEGKISLENSYGIKTAIKIDSANLLNYELAVSLNQLQVKQDTPFALNIRINEIKTSQYTDPGRFRGYGYPYYGRDPYGRNPYASRSRSGTLTKVAPGVWHIVKLAKNN